VKKEGLREWVAYHVPIPFLRKKQELGQERRKRKRDDETLYHTLSIQEVVEKLNADTEKGLTTEKATKLLQANGKNELTGQEGVSLGRFCIGWGMNTSLITTYFVYTLLWYLSRVG